MIESAASDNSIGRTTAWRWCYWGAVVALFGWAAWRRFTLPIEPIADPDTWGYLAPALRKLLGAEFGHTFGRNFVYPGFVFLTVHLFEDFRAIVITQHLLGLMAGLILLLTWGRSGVFVRDSRLSCRSHDGLGLLAVTVFLLAGEPIRFEMQLRPEGVSAFLISVTLYFAVQFIACGFVEKRPGPTIAYGIGTAFVSLLLASAKPSFGLFALITLLPIGIFFFRRGWLQQKILVAIGVVLGAGLLWVPEHVLSRQDEASRTILPATLFVIHADLLRDQITDDLKLGGEIPYSRELLERVRDGLETEIPKSNQAHPAHFPSLGFCPDYLLYERSSIGAQLRLEFNNDVPALCSFYWYYYGRIWRKRPFLVAGKIARQMALFYSQMCPAYNRDKFLHLADAYRNGANTFELQPYHELWMAYPPAVRLVERTELLAQGTPPIRQSAPLRIVLSTLAGIYRPLLLGVLLFSGVLMCRRNYRSRLGWLAAWVLMLYLATGACCLEVAIIHSLDNRRYSTVQAILTILSQFSALWFLWEIALENHKRAKAVNRG